MIGCRLAVVRKFALKLVGDFLLWIIYCCGAVFPRLRRSVYIFTCGTNEAPLPPIASCSDDGEVYYPRTQRGVRAGRN